MDRLSHILPTVLRERGLSDDALGGVVLKATQEWIARELPDHVLFLSARSFSQGLLTVEAKNAEALAACDAKAAVLIRAVAVLPWKIQVQDVRVVRARP